MQSRSRGSGLNTFRLRYSASFTRQRRFSLWPDSQMHSFCADSQRKAAGTARRIDCTLWIYPPERPQAVLHFVTTAQQRNYEAPWVSAICRPLSSVRKKRGTCSFGIFYELMVWKQFFFIFARYYTRTFNWEKSRERLRKIASKLHWDNIGF